MKGNCSTCAKKETCNKICGIMFGFCNTAYEERQSNGEMRLFRVTFDGLEWGLYSATSRQAVRSFLKELGVAESDIRAIMQVGRVPTGCSVVETGV